LPPLKTHAPAAARDPKSLDKTRLPVRHCPVETPTAMPVPLLDVNAQNLPLERELTEAFTRVLRSGRFILGEEVEAFEHECAAALGAAHAVSMSSGTDALLAALMALDIGPGDEVLCPAFSFFASAGSIRRTGAVPVFCDVCPVCFNLDVNSARARLSERTKAIMPVHLFGQSADMDGLMGFAADNGLAVVEDAAQAFGARHRGRACGTIGHFGCFSFFPSKNLGGFGDGGLVATADPAMAERLRRLRNHGMHPKYRHPEVGGNFRLDALQCALLRIKLRHAGEYRDGRARNAARYGEILGQLPGVTLADPRHCQCAEAQDRDFETRSTVLALPVGYGHNHHIWNQYTMRVLGGRRDSLMQHLAARGIGCEIYYPVPLHRQECFAGLPDHALQPCPVAEQLAGEALSIPIYAELGEARLLEAAGAIEEWVLAA
jgi:dTDP-4-amino-4,6-dideoxygalactose transaminase